MKDTTYRVVWEERHSALVGAKSEELAKTMAMEMPVDDTFEELTLIEVIKE